MSPAACVPVRSQFCGTDASVFLEKRLLRDGLIRDFDTASTPPFGTGVVENQRLSVWQLSDRGWRIGFRLNYMVLLYQVQRILQKHQGTVLLGKPCWSEQPNR